MARPERNSVDYFPIFNPQKLTKSRILSNVFKIRYKALRNSSSGFIKRNEVRNFILERDKNKCVECGNTENLHIDHIVSVYRYALNMMDYRELNSPNNLRSLCCKCNTSKTP